ncbi:SCO6745 family protein [Saccharothrix lopnurensis]|uniref:SalK n=1 Tax=Saccharothrix lopnurensis TaxID=1670621 RepID=A0ABW1PGV6_9PSEU
MRTTPRNLWLRFETYHDVIYFTPESRATTDALGCKGGWMGYFGLRAAPLGAVSPEVVTAAFFGFAPRRVARALPDAWEVAPPERFLAARLEGVDGALRRMLGDVDLTEAAALAVEAAAATPVGGRVLGAANRALPVPGEPHLALWQACTTLRESRGDGHVAALVAADLTACEALALFGADHDLAPAYLREARGWLEGEWEAAVDSLRSRGLLSGGSAPAGQTPGSSAPAGRAPEGQAPEGQAPEGRLPQGSPATNLTPAGRALREEVERRTDEAAASPWRALGEDRTARFAELMTPVALRLGRLNDAMRTNPMAIDPVRQLAG